MMGGGGGVVRRFRVRFRAGSTRFASNARALTGAFRASICSTRSRSNPVLGRKGVPAVFYGFIREFAAYCRNARFGVRLRVGAFVFFSTTPFYSRSPYAFVDSTREARTEHVARRLEKRRSDVATPHGASRTEIRFVHSAREQRTNADPSNPVRFGGSDVISHETSRNSSCRGFTMLSYAKHA